MRTDGDWGKTGHNRNSRVNEDSSALQYLRCATHNAAMCKEFILVITNDKNKVRLMVEELQ